MDDVRDETGRRWIEPDDLLRLVRRDVSVSGNEPPEDVLSREPHCLVPVSVATVPALDVHAYRVRLERWERGEGPRLTGMREFVRVLETYPAPARAVGVTGTTTTYTFLLDASMSRVLACVAIDAPPTV
ncbi:hypothetical protein [Nocardioides sp. CER19]|uniref:hypothetical protein n=1 Tax=Nocardioides sp. CER19 TaxID=3038538 RepID=UPI00244A8513|nr:hypothetical protein [Nocardioides sp. CER19]MDH2413835.1 hypothetical protein [Nocardioides sp. CER19]